MTTSNPLVLEMPDIVTFTVRRKEFNPVSFSILTAMPFLANCLSTVTLHLCVVYE